MTLRAPSRLLKVALVAAVFPVGGARAEETPEPSVEVRVRGWGSPRGIGDVRVQRDLLTASPRQQTSEMLSAAPGFFVDHEQGEGLGNDVFFRGFDLEHGSGIEMRIGRVPLNIPTHIHGQGYADVDFLIPETIAAIRVLGGPYDPRQGDAAVVGSAYFELGVAERGYHLKGSYGSFDDRRVMAIAAPDSEGDETFLAVALRATDGAGVRREAESGAVTAQYGFDLGPSTRARLLAVGHGEAASLPGVVRQDHVEAGLIDFHGSYPYFAEGQSAQSTRSILSLELDHDGPGGARVHFTPWVMSTGFRARENYAGVLQSSQIDPSLAGRGDLFETTNSETAFGASASARSAPTQLGRAADLVVEPGVQLRVGGTDQTKSLLEPATLTAWDRRLDQSLETLDAGAYVDADLRLWRDLRISGGPRVDLLSVSIEDRLTNVVPAGSGPPGAQPGARRHASGVSVGPRATVEYTAAPGFTVSASYGEGFRSLDASRLREGDAPYSKVRSGELGLRAHDARRRYTTTLALFRTHVGNELVFVAEEGGLESQNASTRQGVVSSFVARPVPFFLGSASLSVTSAEYDTLVPGIRHHVPNVPPLLLRTDATLRGSLGRVGGRSVEGRVGLGYTFIAGRRLTDALMTEPDHVLNAGGQIRYGAVEIALDGYNVLDREYADSADRYISNFSLSPGQQPASVATHYVAAAPAAVVASVSVQY